MAGLLWTVASILIVLWLVGFLLAHVGGPLIHLLLVFALVAIIYQVATGRSAV